MALHEKDSFVSAPLAVTLMSPKNSPYLTSLVSVTIQFVPGTSTSKILRVVKFDWYKLHLMNFTYRFLGQTYEYPLLVLKTVNVLGSSYYFSADFHR